MTQTAEPAIIKKYPNRRLYDTETSMYVTLENLRDMVREGKEFIVVDAKTGQDLTRQTLAQIIFELETQGQQLLPTNFLRSVIGFYDDGMRDVLHHYLEASMKTFLSNQEKMRGYLGKAMKDFSPLSQFEEITRQNFAFFEKTMNMFNPFGGRYGQGPEPKEREEKPRSKKK